MMLLSVFISYQGITKLKRDQIWESRYSPEEFHDHEPWFIFLTRHTIIFMDLILGKITVVVLLISVPYACGRLAFEFEYLYTGLFTLLAVTAYLFWIAMSARLFNAFIPMVRM